jgi:hypothetical protein
VIEFWLNSDLFLLIFGVLPCPFARLALDHPSRAPKASRCVVTV